MSGFTLILDCSVKNISLCLVHSEKNIRSILASSHQVPQETQSKVLLKDIDALFQKTKITLPEINKVVFCHGPGSFTSLRVGLATLKGLFWQRTDLEYAGVSSLLFRCLVLKKKNPAEIYVSTIRMGRERFATGILFSEINAAWAQDFSFSEILVKNEKMNQKYFFAESILPADSLRRLFSQIILASPKIAPNSFSFGGEGVAGGFDVADAETLADLLSLTPKKTGSLSTAQLEYLLAPDIG